MCRHVCHVHYLSSVNVYTLFQVVLLCFEPCCKIPRHWRYAVTAVENSKSENSPFSLRKIRGDKGVKKEPV